jgi:hypothetical protein
MGERQICCSENKQYGNEKGIELPTKRTGSWGHAAVWNEARHKPAAPEHVP